MTTRRANEAGPEKRLKPKLLVLASTYPRWPNDPEPGFVAGLATRMTMDFDVVVLCPHAAGAMERETVDGVRVIRYRYAPARFETLVNDGGIINNLARSKWKALLVPGFVFSLFYNTWITTRNERPDVIHAHWLVPQGLAAALLSGTSQTSTPFVVTSHGADLFALQGHVMRLIKRFVVGRAASMTVVSHAMAEESRRQGLGNIEMSIQPMGVDLAGLFTPDPSVARSSEEILFVGRLVEKKGLRHLIDAMPSILKQVPNAVLTIAGFGPEEAACRALIERLGLIDKVRFVGAVPQRKLPALYRRAAVFVAPFVRSLSGDQEGLGLVLVEAAGCHCPIVASDLPAVRDVVGAAPVTLVKPGNPDSIAAAVVAALSGPNTARQDDDVARTLLRKRFDWGVVASGYVAKLRHAAGWPEQLPGG